MARWLDILRSTKKQNLGEVLIQLAREAAALHRRHDAADCAADRAAEEPLVDATPPSSFEQYRVEGLDPRTAACDVRASGTSIAVTDDGESTRSISIAVTATEEAPR